MKKNNGFTLIELLVVISIMGILLALSVFGMQKARESSRDGKRKGDLEQIRSGLEMYKSDCGSYPASLTWGSSLIGNNSSTGCSDDNTYIAIIPEDPLSSTSRTYLYSSDGTDYEVCSSLEGGSGSVTCGGSSNCGDGFTCNYKVISP